MAKHLCNCGKVLRLPGEGENEWVLLSVRRYYEILNAIEGEADLEKACDLLQEHHIPVVICDRCGRIYIDKADGSCVRYTPIRIGYPEFLACRNIDIRDEDAGDS